jgi:hypothetical protein
MSSRNELRRRADCCAAQDNNNKTMQATTNQATPLANHATPLADNQATLLANNPDTLSGATPTIRTRCPGPRQQQPGCTRSQPPHGYASCVHRQQSGHAVRGHGNNNQAARAANPHMATLAVYTAQNNTNVKQQPGCARSQPPHGYASCVHRSK